MSQESNELIREVNASLKNDKIKEFFNKNSKTIIIGLSVVVLILAVVVAQFIRTNSKNKKYSAQIQESITYQQLGEVANSKENLEKVYYDKGSPENLRAIAGFRLAAVYLTENNPDDMEKIISIYEEINHCKTCDIYSKDLAGMLWVRFMLTNSKDTPYEDMIAKIIRVENTSKSFKYEIAIDRGFYELQSNHLEKSREIFEYVSNSLEAGAVAKDTAKKGIRIIEQKIANNIQ